MQESKARIIVIGCPGAGKSTFARALRDKTGLPLYYLDMLYHKPDRTTVTREEFDQKLISILRTDRWIIDGNYQRTLPLRFEACTDIFFLDFPLEQCLKGVESRIGTVWEDMPWIEQEFDPEFRRYILDFQKDQLPRIYDLVDQYRKTRRITVFHSREEMSQWLDALELYLPKPEDGWFYINMLSDPATMAYNAPWFPPDGCIPNPERGWANLQAEWIGREPRRFYAYLRRKSDGAFVGDVNYHYNPERNWWDMGILIYAPERGKGYGRQGLQLLLHQAFRVDDIPSLHNDFERSRNAAYHIHKAFGFRELDRKDGICQLELTREEYLSQIIYAEESYEQ